MQNTPPVWTVLSMLEWATAYFEKKGISDPRLSIEWLLAAVLEKKRLDLYLNYDRPLSAGELDRLRSYVKRRAGHEPLQYITGSAQFHAAEIKVNRHVLIPRQETEQLVQLILDRFPAGQPRKIIDAGTGSGCIPVALKMMRPEWHATAIDISEKALQIAAENAILNNVEIKFLQQDFFNPVFEDSDISFDIIISNPPYILKTEEGSLEKEVKGFEPHLALFCESTRAVFGALEKFCTKYLAPGGTAIFEINAEQAAETRRIFTEKNWVTEIFQDYDLKDRFLLIKQK